MTDIQNSIKEYTQKKEVGFYKRLNWWQKILYWIGFTTLCLVVFIAARIVPIALKATEEFKAEQGLAYSTVGDTIVLIDALPFRIILNNWGFDRDGLIQKLTASALKSNYEGIKATVPDTDCELYYSDLIYDQFPFIVYPNKEDLSYLTPKLIANAKKIFDLPCKSITAEKFFKVHAYRGFLLFLQGIYRLLN